MTMAFLSLDIGLEDKVVLPNQATMMYDAVAAKKIPTAIEMFEGTGLRCYDCYACSHTLCSINLGEGHGW